MTDSEKEKPAANFIKNGQAKVKKTRMTEAIGLTSFSVSWGRMMPQIESSSKRRSLLTVRQSELMLISMKLTGL